jgi:hypothetical protein
MEKVTIGTAELWRGDWEEVLPHLPTFDALVTDPPYGIEADKAGAHSSIRDNPIWKKGEWDSKRPEPSTLIKLAHLSKTAAIWGGNYFADCFPPSSGWLIWRKPEAETGFSMADAELCWTSLPFSARMKTFPRRDGNDHPTQKTVAVMAWTMAQIKIPQGAVVLDTYMGSGTVGVACMDSGRAFIGVEKDRQYFDIACERIDRAQQQGKLF